MKAEDQARAERQKALALCRGCYQRGIVLGYQRLSGADLRGTAKHYGGRYAQSRDNLLWRLKKAKIAFEESVTQRGKRILVWGERNVWLALNGWKISLYSSQLHSKLVRATRTGYGYAKLRREAEVLFEMEKLADEELRKARR